MIEQSSLFLVFCVIVGCLAKPPPTFLEYKDSLGQYSFGYSAPGSARSEVRSFDGSTRGSYSYVDALGNIQSAQYTADGENGFQIVATNLPKAPTPVEDTPEVSAARIAHLKAYEVASKLAESQPDQDAYKSAIEAGKPTETIIFDEAAGSRDKMFIQGQARSVKTSETMENGSSADRQTAIAAEANKMQIPTQLRNVNSLGPVEKSSSMESPSSKPNETDLTLAKSAIEGNQEQATEILEKSGQHGTGEQSAQSQAQTREASSRSDVPVVTTSFVIPSSLNFHTRIRLDQSGGAAAQVGPQASAFIITQPSLSQDANANPSMQTPAGTRMKTTDSSEKAAILEGMSPLFPAPMRSIENIDRPEKYSNAIVPGVIAPSNVFAFTYGVGVNPIYRHYSPYQYFSYL